MNTLEACLTTVQAAGRTPDFIAGCYQAAGAVRASVISLWGGLSAIFAAMIGLAAVIWNSRDAVAAEKRTAIRTVKRISTAYLAEITSLEDFFTAHDVAGTLKVAAARNAVLLARNIGQPASEEDIQKAAEFDPNQGPFRVYFHPGDQWMKYYLADPTSVGALPESVASDLVSYCCRMHNELGRLRWLHDLSIEELLNMGISALAIEQERTVNNLDALNDLAATKVKPELRSIIEA